MRTTLLATFTAALSVLTACEGSELRRPLSADTTVPDTADTSDGDVTPTEPKVEFWFVGRGGEIGRDLGAVTLFPSDEPEAYAQFPGFQIDLKIETAGVASGEEVRLFVDGTIASVDTIELDGEVGSAGFVSVTIPERDAPVVVRIETESAEGDELSAQKSVTVESGDCAVAIAIAETEGGCVALGEAGFTVTATLEGGPCTRVAGVVTIDGDTYDLAEQPFVDGSATLAVSLPGELVEGDVEVVVEARGADGDEVLATESATGKLDLVTPGVTLLAPIEGGIVTLGDDVNAGEEGLQFEVRAEVGLGDAEAATVVLSIDGDEVATTEATGPGPVSFGEVTLEQNGDTTFLVTAVDGCGNRAEQTVEVLVLSSAGRIVITQPAAGATLLAAADVDPATATIYETTFEVTTSGAQVGATIVVECQDAAATEDWTVVGTTTIAAGGLQPSGRYSVAVADDVVAIGAAAQVCRARIDLPAAATSEPIGVTFGIPAGTLSLTAPVAGACINADAITFEGSATNAAGQTLRLTGAGPNPAAGPIQVDLATVAEDGTWSGTYTPGDDDGAYTFEVAGEDVFGNPFAAGPVSVAVDRLPPAFTLTAPPAALDGLAVPDSDPATPGYQTTATVAVTEATSLAGGEVCLAVNGAAARCLPLAASVSFTSVTLAVGANTLTVTGRDGCANAAPQVTRTVTLSLDNPIAITAPAGGATLLAKNDGNAATSTTYETTFAVDADRATVGAAIQVACRPAAGGGFVQVGATTVLTVAADGVYQVPVLLDTVALGTTLECRATIDLPAAGTSANVALRVGLPAPSLTIDTPASGACLTGDATVAGAATGLDGRTVTASLRSTSGASVASTTANVAAGGWSGTLALGTAADGAYTLTGAATDAFGNDIADHNPPAVAVLVDRTAPIASFIGPVGPLDGTADVDGGTPGVQVDVTVALQDERAIGGEVCLALGGSPLGCEPVASLADPIVFSGVTLQGGTNTFTVTGRDACGNAATAATASVELSAATPVVAITSPSADLVTAETTQDFVVTVTDVDGTTPLAGLAVSLFAGAADTGATALDNGDGTYTFAAVALPAGVATSFTARAVRQGATGVSPARVITQKNVAPTIAVTSPADGTAFNLASTACAAGQRDCVLTATATTANAEEGSLASLEVTCGGASASYAGTVTGNVATFADVALVHGGSCALVAAVTDAAGQDATSDTITVTVDRVAPTVSIAKPGLTLLSPDDLDPAAPGIQADFIATLSGVSAGTRVTATLSWNAGGPQTRGYEHLVATDTAETATYDAEFQDGSTGSVSWPVGVVTMTITVADAAGNSTTFARTVTVDEAAGIRITSPAAAADTCGNGCAAGTVCHEGACWRTWGTTDSRQFTALVFGLQTTSQNVRVCSDHPSLEAAGAPLCDTPASATGAYRQVLLSNASSGTTILNVGTVLPEGFQRVVLEAKAIEGGSWISSMSAANTNERLRRLFIDLVVPVVSDLSSPSDTIEPLGTLNAAEQKASPRVYELRFASTEAGTAQVYVNGAVALTRAIDAGATTIDLTLPEGNPQVWVVVTDGARNASPASPGAGAVTYQPIVDVTAPTLTFTRPNKTPLKSGDNLDVVLASNAEGRTVVLLDAGAQVATGTVSGGVVTFSDATLDILTEGNHTLTATVTDAAGNSTTAATVPATVLVDTVPPTCEITAPLDGAALTDADDADPATPGFQVAVTFTTGNGATSWSLWSAEGCDATWANCAPAVTETSGTVTNPGGAEPAAVITLDTDAAVTFQKIILQTVDASGNVHMSEVDVQISVTNCTISFSGHPANGWFNASACANGAPSCATAQVSVDVTFVGVCAANRLRLFDGATQLGEVQNPGASETFVFTVTNDVDLALEAKAFLGANEIATTGVEPFGVDLTPPDVSFASTSVAGFTTPAEGASVTYAVAQDLDRTTAGMQLHAAVRVADTNVAGGAITSISATAGGAPVLLAPSNGPLPLELAGTSPVVTSLLDLTLADNATHTVVVRATDAAGNVDTGTFTAKVDVTAPAEVPITQITVQVRRPRLLPLTFTAVGDDGTGNGRVTAYEVRYSYGPIDSEAAWAAACKATDLYGSNPPPTPTDPGTSIATAIGAPDPRSFNDPCKWEIRVDDGTGATTTAMYWAVRARDDVNNWSPLGSQSVRALTNSQVWLRLGRVRFDNANGSFGAGFNTDFLTFRGALLGDINGDGRQDWAVGSTNSNAFCVVLGQNNPALDQTITDPEGPTHTCLLGSEVASIQGLPAVQAGGTTGNHIEPLGDVNGDGLADFGVSGKIANGTAPAPSHGYVLVYLGRSGQLPDLTAPNLKIFGLRAQSGTAFYTGFCGAGDFDGLVTNNRTTSDIAVGEPFANAVHVIPGQGTWDASTNLTVDLALAGTITGAWTVNGSFTTAGANFGSRCAPAGDLLPTPTGLGTGAKGDLLVVQSGSADSRVFAFAGREWATSTVETVSENIPATPTAEDQRSLRLRQESDQIRSGFGINLQGGVDLTSDGVPDVLVSNGARSPEILVSNVAGDGKTVYIFDGAKLPSLLGTDVRVTVSGNPVNESWKGVNGFVLKSSVANFNRAVRVIGDFNSWATGNPSRPSLDLALANNNVNSTDAIQLRTNHLRLPAIAHGQFPVVDGEFFNVYNDFGNALGTWIEGGVDLTGDALPDILTGGTRGEVLIVR